MFRLACALICEICFGLETPIQTPSFQDAIASAAMKKKQHLSVKLHVRNHYIALFYPFPLQHFNPEDYRFTAALCILKKLSQRSSNPHPCCVANSLPVAHTPTNSEAPSSSSNSEAKVATPPTPPPPEVPEEAAQLAVKAAEAFLGSVDHNDIEGSQYQLVSHMINSVHGYSYI